MRVVLTGGDGFIAVNLRINLAERAGTQVIPVTRTTSRRELEEAISTADAVVHLAGVNRPREGQSYAENGAFTAEVCGAVRRSGRPTPVILSSSVQAGLDNAYGASKREAEGHVLALREAGNPVAIFRLPNVFGKWARPGYNSAIATFCHNAAHGLPLTIHDPAAPLTLAYVDDVVGAFLRCLGGAWPGDGWAEVDPVHHTTVGEAACLISSFGSSRESSMPGRVGCGLARALYATYLSYVPPKSFSYPLKRNTDARGSFCEVLRTPDCGQFSFFTAAPGVTRGGHYHHTKSEKFIVVQGQARFRFKDMRTGAAAEVEARGSDPVVVETVPGWAHDITNTGNTDLVVLLWANEVFDRDRPDTFMHAAGK